MDNADLEKLKVSPGRLVPKFKASVTEYSVTLGSELKEVKVAPLSCDSGASCVIKVRDRPLLGCAAAAVLYATYCLSDT